MPMATSPWVAPMLPFPSWSHCVSCGLCHRHHTLSRALFQHPDFLTSHAVLTEICAPPPPPVLCCNSLTCFVPWLPRGLPAVIMSLLNTLHSVHSQIGSSVGSVEHSQKHEVLSQSDTTLHAWIVSYWEEGPDLPSLPFLDQPQSDLAQLPGGDGHHSWRCLTNSL